MKTGHCVFLEVVSVFLPLVLVKKKNTEKGKEVFKACFKRRATAVHDTSTTWFQTSNLIQSNRTAFAKTKHNNKETVRETLKCILMHL